MSQSQYVNSNSPPGAAASAQHWRRRWLTPIAVVVLLLVADQVTKQVVRETLGDGVGSRRFDILGDWLGLSYVENRGAAFGAFVGYGTILSVVALGVIVGTTVLFARIAAPSVWLRVGLGLVIGGALGNVIDRARLGFVVDFVAVGAWPRFNVADSAITIGVLLLAWRLGGAEGDPDRTPEQRAAHARTNDDDVRAARPDGNDG